MSFRKGDVLMVIEKPDPNWWMGMTDSQSSRGLFPSTYVRAIWHRPHCLHSVGGLISDNEVSPPPKSSSMDCVASYWKSRHTRTGLKRQITRPMLQNSPSLNSTAVPNRAFKLKPSSLMFSFLYYKKLHILCALIARLEHIYISESIVLHINAFISGLDTGHLQIILLVPSSIICLSTVRVKHTYIYRVELQAFPDRDLLMPRG